MNRHLGWSSDDSHPAEEDLLFYVDGELPATETARIRAHLKACWTCRAKTERIQETIGSFVHFLNCSVAPNIGDPPHGWRGLEGPMAQAAAQARRRPHRLQWPGALKRFFTGWPPARTLALGAAVLGVLLTVVIRFERVPPVSAKQLIENVADAREDRLRAVVQPVVYQKLELRRTAPSSRETGRVTWEIWNDLSRNRFKQRIEEEPGAGTLPARSRARSAAAQGQSERFTTDAADGEEPGGSEAVVQELTEIFEANRMDPRAPLSPVEYQAWRGHMRPGSEAVEQTNLADGSRAFTLTARVAGPFTRNAIVQVELVVRNADWHPVEQHLKVRGEYGVLNFSLTETAYAVQPVGGLPPNFFTPLLFPAPLSAPTSVRLPEPFVAPVIEPIIRPGADESAALEIEALFALHRTGACLGGMVSVNRRDSGTIDVRGVVSSVERREEILAALPGTPWVQTNLRTAEEIPAADPSASSDQTNDRSGNETVPPAEQPVTIDVPRAKMPVQDLLNQYFSANRDAGSAGAPKSGGIGERIAWFSNRAVSVSETALEEAWELRRLIDRSVVLTADKPPPSARYALDGMIRDHMTALRAQLAIYREVVDPVLSSILLSDQGAVVAMAEQPAPAPEAPEGTGSTANSLAVVDTVERIVRLSLGLFADGSFSVPERNTAMRELQSKLSHWEEDFQDLESRLASRTIRMRLPSNARSSFKKDP